jgi:hypothetical protein
MALQVHGGFVVKKCKGRFLQRPHHHFQIVCRGGGGSGSGSGCLNDNLVRNIAAKDALSVQAVPLMTANMHEIDCIYVIVFLATSGI